MKLFKNPEFFKVGNSKMVTVSITMCLDEKSSPSTAILNAYDALKFFDTSGNHKSFVTKIVVDK